MRCPKCGYISFDNVEKCLKCKKNISATAKLFQGSVLNVAAPVFLKQAIDDEDVDLDMDVDMEVGDLDDSDEDFDVSDPDLDILLADEDGSTAEVQLTLDGDDDEELSELDELDGDFTEIEAFEEETQDDEVSLDLGMMEDDSVEEAFAPEEASGELEQSVSMEIPEELADLSDLSPPDSTIDEQPAETVELEAEAEKELETEADFDFSSLDMEAAFEDEPVPAPKPKKEAELSLDMDEELDFELDLGGLSIHDDK